MRREAAKFWRRNRKTIRSRARRTRKSLEPPVRYFQETSDRLRRPAGWPLLITVTTIGKRATLRDVAASLRERAVWHERWSYDHLFAARSLPRATYVLTDFDRLHPWHLELAGRFHDRLTDAGLTVLNDPRRFVPRAALLRRLYREGVNGFTCWLPVDGEVPERFPVFLRTLSAHRGVESGLLETAEAAEAALAGALRAGLVLQDLAFVEFCAEADPASGVYRKHACQGIGGRMIRALSVSDRDWVAKHGQSGAASVAQYRADLEEHRAYPHADLMRRVLDLAGLDFGRVDFAIVEGRPQVYEVNSNPTIAWTREHPVTARMEADLMVRNEITSALADLALRDRGGQVDVHDLLPRAFWQRSAKGQP